LVLAGLTVLQLRHWRSDVALFSHAVRVTRENAIAHNNLGAALGREGRLEEDIAHRREAIRYAGSHAEACKFHAGLGQALDSAGRDDEALAALREAVRLCPQHGQAQNDIAVLLIERGDLAGATAHLRSALSVLPDHPQLHAHLGLAIEMQGNVEAAVDEYRRALVLDPDEPLAAARLRLLGRTAGGP
jgi:Flp pilus assembly protein TadD